MEAPILDSKQDLLSLFSLVSSIILDIQTSWNQLLLELALLDQVCFEVHHVRIQPPALLDYYWVPVGWK